MYNKCLQIILAVFIVSALSGCATWRKLNNTEKGATIGAGTGAIIGAAAGGPVGTIVGAAAGAFGGLVIGGEIR
jgi:uncharacterized protein YceK